MIVKLRDARAETISRLEKTAIRTTDEVRKTACIGAAARLRDDSTTQEACDLIDHYFGESEDWAVIHDLRLRVGTHAFQLNHVLISNSLECVCLDTRFLKYGLMTDENGRCEAHSSHRRFLVASPMTKMERDSRMLSIRMGSSDVLPRHFGIGPRATVRGYILTNPALRSIAATPDDCGARNSVSVESADGLFPLLWKRNLRWSQTRFERLTPDALLSIAERLATQHQSSFSQALLSDNLDTLPLSSVQSEESSNPVMTAMAMEMQLRRVTGA